MASINTMANNKDSKIEALWVMSGASVMKSRTTRETVGFLCYCQECKDKSVSGDGGIGFNTPEELLAHRKMKAFECPSGCGFHICEEFGSIVRHLDAYHKEELAKLEKAGLDLTTKKRVWIYPDYSNNTYTLTKPMPVMEASPLENAGVILAMTPPKRVAATPSPVPQETKPKGKGRKFVPFNPIGETVQPSQSASASSGPPKTWANTKREGVSFTRVMEEQKKNADDAAAIAEQMSHTKPVHYAQDDMRKEKQCPYGKGCVKRDRPFACALNHDGKGDVILRGTELTEDVLCPYERPPFIRCGDGRCTKIHLEHRAEFIEKKKKEFFASDSNNEMSYSSVASKLKNSNDAGKSVTAVIATSSQGTTMQLSLEDAMAVAAALQDLEDKTDDDEWTEKRATFAASSSSSEATTDEEEDDNDDLSDPAVFAARYNSAAQ